MGLGKWSSCILGMFACVLYGVVNRYGIICVERLRESIIVVFFGKMGFQNREMNEWMNEYKLFACQRLRV